MTLHLMMISGVSDDGSRVPVLKPKRIRIPAVVARTLVPLRADGVLLAVGRDGPHRVLRELLLITVASVTRVNTCRHSSTAC